MSTLVRRLHRTLQPVLRQRGTLRDTSAVGNVALRPRLSCHYSVPALPWNKRTRSDVARRDSNRGVEGTMTKIGKNARATPRAADAKLPPAKDRSFAPDRKGEASGGARASKDKKRSVAAGRDGSNTR